MPVRQGPDGTAADPLAPVPEPGAPFFTWDCARCGREGPPPPRMARPPGATLWELGGALGVDVSVSMWLRGAGDWGLVP